MLLRANGRTRHSLLGSSYLQKNPLGMQLAECIRLRALGALHRPAFL